MVSGMTDRHGRAGRAGRLEPGQLDPLIAACRGGEDGAGDDLCTLLRGPVALGVARLLGDGHPDGEDIVQESLLAALGYLRRDDAFRGDLVRLAVTIARNRCRDLLRRRRRQPQVDIEPLAAWLADPAVSALDALAEDSRRWGLQAALDRLDDACRDLLRAMYVQEVPTDALRRRLGLGTVQAVYYRRSVCLKKVRNFFQEGLAGVQETGSEAVDPAAAGSGTTGREPR